MLLRAGDERVLNAAEDREVGEVTAVCAMQQGRLDFGGRIHNCEYDP